MSVVTPTIPAPMVAARGRPSGGLAGWAVEWKLDGYRCQVLTGPHPQVRTRRGRNITDRVPELEALSRVGPEMILDGELITGAGRPTDFYALAGAVASRRSTGVTFVAFDLLWLDGCSLLEHPYDDRRTLLERLGVLADGALHVVPAFPGPEIDHVLAGCRELQLEGVVAKRRTSRYRPGPKRSTAWTKVKNEEWSRLHASRRLPHHVQVA